MAILVRPTPADPRIGGKARSLARLGADGLPVPPALVVTGELFTRLRSGGPPLPPSLSSLEALRELDHAANRLRQAELPADVIAEVLDALRGWGGQRFSVRSSFAAEDRPGALAAGVYLSRTDLAAEDVLRAIPEVLASALSPGAVAYARRHELDAEAGPFAVLLHPYVAGLTGVAAWDPQVMRAPLLEPEEGVLAGARTIIESACRTMATHMGPVELEWVAEGEQVTFLQARSYTAPALPRRWSERRDDLQAGGWQWDAAHNPLPLSPAQVGLVGLVDERCQVPFRQRVEGGYLFFARTTAAVATAPESLQTELQRLHGLEDELKALGPEPPLEAALELFVRGYQQIFGVVQPAAGRARKELTRFLDASLPAQPPPVLELAAGVPSRASERLQLAEAIAAAPASERAAAVDAYLALFGDEAPIWDVAAATHRETPGAVAALAARGRARPSADPERAARAVAAALPPAVHAEWRRLVAALRAAVAAGEEDDWWYARLQATVRRAMLALGRRLTSSGALLAPDDVFWLPLEWTRLAARGEPLPGDAGQAVRLARQLHVEELADPPPSSWARGARDRVHERTAGDGDVVHGTPASGGRALGRVVHRVVFMGPDAVVSEQTAPDTVLVAATLLPSELPLLHAAALVTETGGALDHVAAQARERGIPAVVGAEGACRLLREGELVLVDGDAGTVVQLS